jgi:hypothetical protein
MTHFPVLFEKESAVYKYGINAPFSIHTGITRNGRDTRPSSSLEVEFLGTIYRAESEVSFQPPRVNPRWRSLSRVFEMPVSSNCPL